MHDVGLAGETPHAFVGLAGEVECLGDEGHLLAVVAPEVGVQQPLERLVHHAFVVLLFQSLLFVHIILLSVSDLDGCSCCAVRSSV